MPEEYCRLMTGSRLPSPGSESVLCSHSIDCTDLLLRYMPLFLAFPEQKILETEKELCNIASGFKNFKRVEVCFGFVFQSESPIDWLQLEMCLKSEQFF